MSGELACCEPRVTATCLPGKSGESYQAPLPTSLPASPPAQPSLQCRLRTKECLRPLCRCADGQRKNRKTDSWVQLPVTT